MTKGFTAAVFDYVSDYQDTPNGWGLTNTHYITYLTWLAGQAKAKGLGVGLVNGVNLVSDAALVSQFDFGVAVGCVANGCASAYSLFKAGGLGGSSMQAAALTWLQVQIQIT